MECTQILAESEEDSPEPSTRERRQVATLKTDGDSYPIFLGENRIGRDPKTCSIVIDNMALSSQHAVIEGLSCGSFLVYDLNSRNKTRIGKMSLTPQVRYQLGNGDSLRFANVHCTFCVKESINLVHLSFDDDIEELKSNTKEEAADDTSAADDSIFDAETQRPEIVEKPSKASEEREECVFKMPQQIQSINTSVVSLDESIGSNGDDIFSLATQPFTYEEGTGVDLKEKERQEENSKDHPSRAERLDVDKKHEKEDVEDKDKSMDESDLDDLFAAATQAYPIESDKMEEDKKEAHSDKSCDSNGKTSDENIPSSVDKEACRKELHKGLQYMKDAVENDIFDLPTQAFTIGEEPCQKDNTGGAAAHTEPSSDSTIPAKADAEKVEKKEAMSDENESREMGHGKDGNIEKDDDSDIDNIFGAATQVPPYMKEEVKEETRTDEGDRKSPNEDSDSSPNVTIDKKGGDQVSQDLGDPDPAPNSKLEVKDKEKSEKIHDFSIEEDSDDVLFASLSTQEEEKPQVSCQDDKDVATIKGSSSVAEGRKQNEKEKSKQEEVSAINDPDGDETDPEDSFSHKTEGMAAKSSDNGENKNKVIDKSCDNSDHDANETLAASARVNSDDDDDTDLEDMCPPSIKKQLPSLKSAFRRANDRDITKLGIGESCSSISSAAATFKLEDSCINVKNGEAKIDVSDRKDDSSFGVLVDATFEDENASLITEKQPGSIVIMSDTDDEKDVDDSSLDLKNSKERFNEKKMKTPTEASKEKSSDTEVNKGTLVTQSVSKDKDAKEEKEKKISEDTVEQTSSEQIGADEEDEDDMSSFLTQAPPDFKTPQATKVESVDESDVSMLETQAPPSPETPTPSKKADKEDLSAVNQSATSNVNIGEDEEEEDMSSFLTQAPPDFKTPQATRMNVSAIESDVSILNTQPPPTLETPKVLNGNDKEDSTRVSSALKGNITADDEEEDDMSSFLTQAPPDFKTPQATREELVDESDKEDLSIVNQSSTSKVNTAEDEDEDDMSSFLTQAPPDFKTPQAIKKESLDESDVSMLESRKADKEDLSIASQSLTSKVNTAEDEDEDDMSSFLTQAPPDFKTPQAVKGKPSDESDISMLETQLPPSPPKVSNRDDTELSSISKGNITADDEEEDDMSSFLTQAPPDFKTPQATKEESVDESDVSMLETQAPPSPETPTPSKKAEKEDLSAVNQSATPNVNTGEDEEEEDDMSSFLTQAPPDFKTPQATNSKVSADESDISILETPIVTKRTEKDDSRKVDVKQSSTLNIALEEEDEEDMSSFLTQAPPDFKTPMAVKNDDLTDDSDVSMLETQPTPSETPKPPNRRLDVQEEENNVETPSAISQKENITSGKEVKESTSEIKTSKPAEDGSLSDEDDLSMLETQPPPTLKENIGDAEGREEKSSSLTQATPEFQTPKTVAEKAKDAQNPQTLKTLEDNIGSEEKDISSSLAKASPDLCTPKVVVKKEPEEVQVETTHKTDGKETDKCVPPDLVVMEKMEASESEFSIKGKETEEDDIEICETQPAPISVSQEPIPLIIKESGCPMSANPGIEDVSSDEDVSLLETQPAPIPEKAEVVNGKQEIINIFKQPSKVLKEITPSRSLRSKFLQKNQKETGRSPSIKESKDSANVEDNDDDSDVGGFLPDTPDLANALQESNWSKYSACKNLFNADSSDANLSELSQETSEADVSLKSAKIEVRRDSSKSSEDMKETKELAEKKQPEVERRNPTRGNASKKLASESSRSSGDTHTRSNRRQKEQSINLEESSPLKNSAEASLDVPSKKDEPLPKRKSLRDKRSKVIEAEESKSQSKENDEKEGTDRKVNLRKRTENCPDEVVKSEVNSTADEPARKRGRPSKRQTENDVKAKASEGFSALSAKSTKTGKGEVLDLEVKHVEVQEVTKGSDNKETVGKKRRSSLIEEVSSEGNEAQKSQSVILISSPRKRHLRGEDRELQPPAKELRVRKKDDKPALSSKNEESSPAHRLRGNPNKEDQSGKEVPSSPTILRKRKLEPVKPESRSPSKTPETVVAEGVRRSVRERKPKRRFSSEERPKDDGISSSEESRRGKVARLNKNIDSHEKDREEPESVPQEVKKRKLDERKTSGGTKRTRSCIENDDREDSAASPSDKRRRKGRPVLEKSAADSSKTESKDHDSPKDERSTRGSSRRGLRDSNISEKSISEEKVVEEKCLEKEISPVKATARGRRRSSKQSVPESTTHESEESERPSTRQDHNQQAQTTRGGRRGARRLPSSEESVPVSSSVEVRLEANKNEQPKGRDNRRGGRNRGRKESDVVSEVTSSEMETSSQKLEVESIVEEKTNTRKGGRRGRKEGSLSQTSAVDKEDKVSSSTSVNLSQENVAVVTDLSYLKSSPVKGRMTAFSPRLSASRVSITEDSERKAVRGRRQKGENYSVLFTGLNEPKLEEMVKRLGGKVVETPQDCSILVTDRLRRTYKLLCVVARGIPIVTVQWLAQSSAIGRFLDPADFFISDKLTEKRFDFSLKMSLEKARVKPLLAGFSVIATPSVKPPPEEIKGIVASAGGEYIPSLSALQQKTPSQLYVVSCQDDSALWKNYLECGSKKRPSRLRSERGKGKSAKDGSNVRLVGVEGLLVSILRQKIDLDDKMFSLG